MGKTLTIIVVVALMALTFMLGYRFRDYQSPSQHERETLARQVDSLKVVAQDALDLADQIAAERDALKKRRPKRKLNDVVKTFDGIPLDALRDSLLRPIVEVDQPR
jgi:hypothetical protein